MFGCLAGCPPPVGIDPESFIPDGLSNGGQAGQISGEWAGSHLYLDCPVSIGHRLGGGRCQILGCVAADKGRDGHDPGAAGG